MSISAGTKLGPYEIVSLLGAGGMGEVYRARHTLLGRDVAIKVLPERVANNSESLKRFEREVRALAALSHPNILEIHDFSSDQGIYYAVMELLEGETLRKAISDGPFSLRKSIEVAGAIAEGLAAAHSKGVIHRDLKPENIFITTDGRVKILDFGLARLSPAVPQQEFSNAATASVEMTQGTVLGTIPYMSPEQVRGMALDARSDIFSFGCVLYEMVTGRRPFTGETAADTMSAILKEDPPPLENVSNELKEIISHCLEKNPEQRFQSARDIAFGLKQSLTRSTTVLGAGDTRRISTKAFWLIAVVLAVAALLAMLNVANLRERIFGQPAARIQSLAVLPLKNLSGDPKQEYFADGMTEELIATMARLESLRVISRTSVMEYKNVRKPLPVVAKELNVDAIVEGSVMQVGERVRITAQLIEAATDRHLWAQSYERDLRDVFALQNEVARSIAQEVQIKLTPKDRQRLASAPTVDPEAYQAYLSGLRYRTSPELSEENMHRAVTIFERAVQLDPKFAQAYTELSMAHSAMVHFGYDVTEERVTKAKAAVDRALEIQPDFPEAHVALGYYHYWCRKDYDQALKEFARAKKDLPNKTTVLVGIAWIQRRQGNFEASIENIKRILESNPRDALLSHETGYTLSIIRRYSEAVRYYDRAISLAPDSFRDYQNKAWNFWLWKGTTDLSRATLENMPQMARTATSRGNWFWQEIYERDYQAALRRLSLTSEVAFKSEEEFTPRSLLEGLAHRLMNEKEKARTSFQAARDLLEEELKTQPKNPRIHRSLGIVYAGLGHKSDAIREGKLATNLYPVSKDALAGPDYVATLALIYVMVEEYDAAFDQIEYLLSIPSALSVPLLKLDPHWDPLRTHPRYQKIIKKNQPAL